MKNQKTLIPVLLTIIVLQSIFIFSSFAPDKKEADDIQPFQITRQYTYGSYFYVLTSGGEAKAFIKE